MGQVDRWLVLNLVLALQSMSEGSFGEFHDFLYNETIASSLFYSHRVCNREFCQFFQSLSPYDQCQITEQTTQPWTSPLGSHHLFVGNRVLLHQVLTFLLPTVCAYRLLLVGRILGMDQGMNNLVTTLIGGVRDVSF